MGIGSYLVKFFLLKLKVNFCHKSEELVHEGSWAAFKGVCKGWCEREGSCFLRSPEALLWHPGTTRLPREGQKLVYFIFSESSRSLHICCPSEAPGKENRALRAECTDTEFVQQNP